MNWAACRDELQKLAADDDGGPGLATPLALGAGGYGAYRAGRGLVRKGRLAGIQAARASRTKMAPAMEYQARLAQKVKTRGAVSRALGSLRGKALKATKGFPSAFRRTALRALKIR